MGECGRERERERERERGRERERERQRETERERERERLVNMLLQRSPHHPFHHYRFDETKTHVSLYAAVL